MRVFIKELFFRKDKSCFFLCALGCIVLVILFKIVEFPVFYFSDQIELFLTIGGHGSFFHYPAGFSRFFPLNKIEFYPILVSGLPLNTIMQGLYWVQALKVAIFFVFFFLALKELSNTHVAIFLSFIFLLFARSVTLYGTLSSTIYPEVCSIITLSMFVYFYLKGLQKNSNLYFAIALLSAAFATYIKEPTFIIFIVFGCMRLLLPPKVDLKEKTFIYALFLNGIIFLALYFLLAYEADNYTEGRTVETLFSIVYILLTTMPFIICSVLLCIFRLIMCVFCKSKLILGDILLCMSLTYTTAFICLRLLSSYYFAISYVLFFFSLAAYSNILQNAVSMHTNNQILSFITNNKFTKIIYCIIILF